MDVPPPTPRATHEPPSACETVLPKLSSNITGWARSTSDAQSTEVARPIAGGLSASRKLSGADELHQASFRFARDSENMSCLQAVWSSARIRLLWCAAPPAHLDHDLPPRPAGFQVTHRLGGFAQLVRLVYHRRPLPCCISSASKARSSLLARAIIMPIS